MQVWNTPLWLTLPSDSALKLRESRHFALRRTLMSVTPSLTRELDATIERGPAECAEKLHQITTLFVESAPLLNDDHIRLFGDVFARLIETIDVRGRAELSSRLAPVKNAPLAILHRLAEEDDIAVA